MVEASAPLATPAGMPALTEPRAGWGHPQKSCVLCSSIYSMTRHELSRCQCCHLRAGLSPDFPLQRWLGGRRKGRSLDFESGVPWSSQHSCTLCRFSWGRKSDQPSLNCFLVNFLPFDMNVAQCREVLGVRGLLSLAGKHGEELCSPDPSLLSLSVSLALWFVSHF